MVQRRALGWTGLLPLVVFPTMTAVVVLTLGWSTAWFALILPNLISSAMGIYMFYAQHHFGQARVPEGLRAAGAALAGEVHATSLVAQEVAAPRRL